jgi:pimeloyl-ACP methyl ester carboxylesterase
LKTSLFTLASLAVLSFLIWQDAVVALLSIGAALLLILPFLRWYEPRLIYYPHLPSRQHEQTPNALGFAFEEVHLTTQDDTKVHGWFVPCESLPDAPTVLFLHGNAGNISHRVERLEIFRDLGVHLLLLDYRGYGLSEGIPNEAGTYQDALAAYEWLIQKGVVSQRLVIYGESLGTAIAVDLAAKQPCGGVVLEAPFTSIGDMAQRMFPVLPVRSLVRNRYDSLSKIAQIQAPVLIFHSRRDEVIPFHHAERLAAASHAKLVELQGGHSDLFFVSAEKYKQAMRQFLADLH